MILMMKQVYNTKFRNLNMLKTSPWIQSDRSKHVKYTDWPLPKMMDILLHNSIYMYISLFSIGRPPKIIFWDIVMSDILRVNDWLFPSGGDQFSGAALLWLITDFEVVYRWSVISTHLSGRSLRMEWVVCYDV